MYLKHHDSHPGFRDNDALIRWVAITLAWVGGILLILKLVLEAVSRISSGVDYISSNSLEPSTEAYRLIVYLGLIIGGFLIYGRLSKFDKLIAEGVWAIVLWHIVLWFLAQRDLWSGWRQFVDAGVFLLIFLTVFCLFSYLLYRLVTGSHSASALQKSESR